MKTTITKPYLFAAAAHFVSKKAAHFVSKEATRYYLNGVFIEPVAKGVMVVATNGYLLFAGYDKNGSTDREIIILPPKIKKEWFTDITATENRVELDGQNAILLKGDTQVDIAQVQEIDGTFPDWRRIVPQETTKSLVYTTKNKLTNEQEQGFYDSVYLSVFSDIAKKLGEKYGRFQISPNGGGPTVIRFPGVNDCFGLLMPYRSSFPEIPEWFTDASTQRQTKI